MGLGASDYTGYVNGNNIGIERRASVRPLRWRARCQNCLTTFQLDHARVEYAKCPNKSCGREVRTDGNHSLANTAQVQEAVRSSNAADAREFHRDNTAVENNTGPRKKSLRDGYFKPPQFTNDRDRESYRQFKHEFDEESERPLKEATEAFEKSTDALARERRKTVAEGVDSEFHITADEWDNINAANELSLSGSDEALSLLNQNVIEQVKIFGQHHDFVNSPANLDALMSYCERNLNAHGIRNIVYVPFEILVRAFARLRLYGLLDEPAHVYIEPEPERENYFAAEERRQKEDAKREAEENNRRGIDPQTGAERIYSPREVRLMSADEFKRCFFSKIAPTFKDLFIALSENRSQQ